MNSTLGLKTKQDKLRMSRMNLKTRRLDLVIQTVCVTEYNYIVSKIKNYI